MTSSRLLLFVTRRLGALLASLVVVSFLVFGLLFIAPGSPEQILLGAQSATPDVISALRAKYHLDDGFLTQYLRWLGGAVQLDFGDSIRTGQSVTETLRPAFGVTIFLGLYAFALALLAGLPLGIVAALRKRSLVDRGVVGLTVIGVSAPVFVTGVILLYVFAVKLGWFPSYGAGEGFFDRLWHLTLPAAALALSAMALLVKLTRAAMIRVLDEDYVAFARARGVPWRRLVFRHALRNAAIPVLTAAGLVLSVVLTGAVLVEATFALPGLGSALVEAVQTKDIPVLQGLVLVIATLIILVNLVVDVLYALVDPRIQFGKATR